MGGNGINKLGTASGDLQRASLALYTRLCLIYATIMDRPPDLSEGAQDTKTTAVPDSAENTSKPALDHKNVPPEDIPDPDEDDLDDLDGTFTR